MLSKNDETKIAVNTSHKSTYLYYTFVCQSAVQLT